MVITGAAVLLVAVLIAHRFVLRDLRALERDYIAAREPTACATQSLLPLAFDNERIGDLDDVVLQQVRTASRESERLRARFKRRHVVPFPPLRSAQRSIATALEAQTRLYLAMIDDPDHSEDELRRLGSSNNRAERRLGRVRTLLLVPTTLDWKRRFVCDNVI